MFTLNNTCPIDNALMLFGMYFYENPESMDLLGSEPAEVALKKSARFFVKEKPVDARAAWVAFLVNSKTIVRNFANLCINVHGSEEHRFYDFFKSAYEIKAVSTCSSSTCTQPVKDHIFEKLIMKYIIKIDNRPRN